METKQLKTFVAVYKSGSFTKAAKLLVTSQPAVSEQIMNLERKLGCRLFDRLGRSIRPTGKAELLYPKAQAVLDDIEKITEEILLEDQTVSGELIIGASTIPGAYILPRLASEFKKQHPEISFEIRIADSSEVVDYVLNHDVLIGVVGAKISSNKLQMSTFVEDELVLVSSAKRKIGNIVSLLKLRQLPFLLREEGSGTRKSIEGFGLGYGFDISQLNTVAVLGSNAAIKEAIKENLGVSILSRVSIRDELESGILKEITIKGVAMKRSFYIATLKNRTLPNNYKVFLESLLGVG